MKAPTVVDFKSLQNLSKMIRKADLSKIHIELLKCLPSMSNMPDLVKFKNELSATALNSLDFSLSGWNLVEHLTKCLPEQFSLVSSHSSS